ncbi:MAG: hypothetical protein COA64_03645 [Henriciella sp.]|nr:MAG: hypothetical protein COA64_03645 [Henriciella sp.]
MNDVRLQPRPLQRPRPLEPPVLIGLPDVPRAVRDEVPGDVLVSGLERRDEQRHAELVLRPRVGTRGDEGFTHLLEAGVLARAQKKARGETVGAKDQFRIGLGDGQIGGCSLARVAHGSPPSGARPV